MKVLGYIDTDFINYKKICTTIMMPWCDFKCNRDAKQIVCHNFSLKDADLVELDVDEFMRKYMDNRMTEAVCLQGLEPFYDYPVLFVLIEKIRKYTNDDIVIYTGYTEEELQYCLPNLSNHFSNIIIKFGRFIPNEEPHYDEVLGVNLASNNQYAKRIS